MLFNVDGFVFSVLVFFLFLSPLENNSMKGIGKHIIWVILTLFASCQETKKVNSNSDKEAVEEVHTVFVSNYPLRFFTEQIAGETVKIIFPADGSGDPAFWKPSIDQISEMQQVDLIFLNGAGYENWLNNISLPNDKVVVTSEAFKEEIVKGELLAMTFEFMYDPTDRDLYEKLIKIFDMSAFLTFLKKNK